MKYNLLHERWIPVQRRSGKTDWVRPADLVSDNPDDPFIAFAAARSDFNTAYAEFMIGLLQTCAMPESEDAWRDWYVNPPTADQLQKAFLQYEEAFNLVGEGPLFLQDFEELNANERSLTALLIDYPGDKTIRLNKDHFFKRLDDFFLSPASAAIALFTQQSMAPAGGAGHRTSLRGGGPWITIVRSTTLWKTLWSNVVDLKNFVDAFPESKPQDFGDKRRIFPWLAPTLTSEKDTGAPTLPPAGSPLQNYWGMPRRIRLNFIAEEGTDSLTGITVPFGAKSYETKNYGVEYHFTWRHPLTPYRFTKGEPSAIKGSSTSLSFQNWSRYAFSQNDNGEPALVVRVAQERMNEWEDLSRDYTLFASGYDMDNMKARAWYEGELPLYNIHADHREQFDGLVEEAIAGFQYVASETNTLIKRANFGEYKQNDTTGKMGWDVAELPTTGDRRQRAGIFGELEDRSRDAFYVCMQQLLNALDSEYVDENIETVKQQWAEHLCAQAHAMFEQKISPNSPAANYPAIARARTEVRLNISPTHRKLRAALGLPKLARGAKS